MSQQRAKRREAIGTVGGGARCGASRHGRTVAAQIRLRRWDKSRRTAHNRRHSITPGCERARRQRLTSTQSERPQPDNRQTEAKTDCAKRSVEESGFGLHRHSSRIDRSRDRFGGSPAFDKCLLLAFIFAQRGHLHLGLAGISPRHCLAVVAQIHLGIPFGITCGFRPFRPGVAVGMERHAFDPKPGATL